jgi:hypothetical protein
MLKDLARINFPVESTVSSRRRRPLRYLLLLLVFLAAVLSVGCDCAEGDTTTAFGPECCCDEGENAAGGEDGDGSGSGTLIFSDIGANNIRRFEGISDLDTAVVTDPPLSGPATRMTRPGLLAIHPTNNELIVCDEGTIAVLFFADPLSVNGDVPPTRILAGNATEMVAPQQAFVDSESDELYVLDRGSNQILVYSAGATVQADVAPIRRIGGPASGILNPTAFIVRPSIDQLTVINPTEVLTFTDFRNINGDVDPAGRVNGEATTFQNLAYGEFDSSNSLILVDRGTRSILYFEDFDFDQSNQAPTRVIQGNNTGINEPGQFVLTAAGNMYLANGPDVLFFESLRELVGDPFPNRRFSALLPPSQSIRGLLAP